MDFNFDNLKKIPPEPAARMLAGANMKLETQLQSPPSAPVDVVLQELADKEAFFDVLTLLSVVLPVREAIWWACLSARDIVGKDEKQTTPSLSAAEAWVFKPNADNRAAALVAMDTADIDDDTVYCAMAVAYAEAAPGSADTPVVQAAPNAVPASIVSMNMLSLSEAADRGTLMEDHMALLINRALDIARGGNGRVENTSDGAPVHGAAG